MRFVNVVTHVLIRLSNYAPINNTEDLRNQTIKERFYTMINVNTRNTRSCALSTRNISIRSTFAEVSFPLKNIKSVIERRHPQLTYEGAAQGYEDIADYYPHGATLRGTVLG